MLVRQLEVTTDSVGVERIACRLFQVVGPLNLLTNLTSFGPLAGVSQAEGEGVPGPPGPRFRSPRPVHKAMYLSIPLLRPRASTLTPESRS